MPRPRGPEYEKNLLKRIRQKERKLELDKDGIYREIPGNTQKNDPVNPGKVNEKLLTLAKSFLGTVDSPGVAGKYSKTPVYTWEQSQMLADGVRLRPVWRIDYSMLKQATYGTSIISAIHTIRIDDLIRFATVSRKEGIWFVMEDEAEKISPEIETLMKTCGDFFKLMGDRVAGWSERDHLYPVFEMMLRDTLSVDGIALYIVKNHFGKPIEMKYLDPTTIFPVDVDKGYLGDRSIRYVQIVDNNVVETFGPDELIWTHKNHLSDIQLRGWGFSPLEAVMLDLIGVINSLKYNRDRFTRQPPPGFLSVMGDLSQDSIEALEIQWREMVSGLDDSHGIPIMSSSAGEIKWTPLNLANDMLFKDFMQWLVSFVLMGHGMDQAELGLRLLGSQTLAEANQSDKIKGSMTRAKKSLLTYFESVFNKVKLYFPEYDAFRVSFSGKDPEDEKEKLAKMKEEVTHFRTIDEVRVAQDLPTLGKAMADMYGEDPETTKKAGALILNPTFMQHMMGVNQPAMDQYPEEESEENIPNDDSYPFDEDLEFEEE